MNVEPSALVDALHDRYTIERELGRGGMATVYLARDRKHGRPVALKVLRPQLAESLGTERFLREIELAAGLTHPHIVPVHDSGVAGGLLYYVMPYVEGESLRERLAREHRLPLDEAVRLTREVADALDYAHRRGIVHRDIKPENILLAEGHAVVTDFGIARAVSAAGGERLTQTGGAIGTPMYMSPEQADGEPDLDGRSDIYRLGCVLFEALTGLPPFSGASAQAILVRRLIESPPLVRTVDVTIPIEIEAAIERALARQPGDRFATAAGFSSALGAADSGAQKAGSAGELLSSGGQRTAAASVAVLPFVNLSPDPENEYFSDGMTHEIMNALAKVKGLRVAARTSSFTFKGKDVDAREIGRRLNVGTLLEGSVRKAGDKLRITAQLVNAADGYHLWSNTYERTLADVFAVQDDLARSIAGALSDTVGGSPGAPPMVKRATESLDAYTHYLRGHYLASKRTVEGFRAGIEHFERAIQRDPAYSLAYAELAGCWAFRGFDEFGDLPPLEAMPKAKAAVHDALELDQSLADAHLWKGVIAMLFDWDWSAAELEFQHSLALAPEHALAHTWYAIFLGAMGRYEPSIRLVQRAASLDPLSLTIQHCVARIHVFGGRYDEALEQLRVVREMEPNNGLTYVWLGRALCRANRFREAVDQLEQGITLVGNLPTLLTVAGHAYGRIGAQDLALQMLQTLRQQGKRRYISPWCEGVILDGMGRVDEAFTLRELAFEHRSGFLAFLRVSPDLDPATLASPRGRALLQKMRLDF